ncbi:hypothetical protein B0J13DRAFT_518633 [Dactylonectria estremocensis]|uniref:Uncharacterized protein n=1 Tax=Dactylonectria estremocensis TaxID=1079267 RepID=A0A9P9FLT8_9HYPO|nr:hypothetical protein B0J13DRAFT_518633 [Dactylonectria estremocensis]
MDSSCLDAFFPFRLVPHIPGEGEGEHEDAGAPPITTDAGHATYSRVHLTYAARSCTHPEMGVGSEAFGLEALVASIALKARTKPSPGFNETHDARRFRWALVVGFRPGTVVQHQVARPIGTHIRRQTHGRVSLQQGCEADANWILARCCYAAASGPSAVVSWMSFPNSVSAADSSAHALQQPFTDPSPICRPATKTTNALMEAYRRYTGGRGRTLGLIRAVTVAAALAQPFCHTRPRGFLRNGLNNENDHTSCVAMGNNWTYDY